MHVCAWSTWSFQVFQRLACRAMTVQRTQPLYQIGLRWGLLCRFGGLTLWAAFAIQYQQYWHLWEWSFRIHPWSSAHAFILWPSVGSNSFSSIWKGSCCSWSETWCRSSDAGAIYSCYCSCAYCAQYEGSKFLPVYTACKTFGRIWAIFCWYCWLLCTCRAIYVSFSQLGDSSCVYARSTLHFCSIVPTLCTPSYTFYTYTSTSIYISKVNWHSASASDCNASPRNLED